MQTAGKGRIDNVPQLSRTKSQ